MNLNLIVSRFKFIFYLTLTLILEIKIVKFFVSIPIQKKNQKITVNNKKMK